MMNLYCKVCDDLLKTTNDKDIYPCSNCLYNEYDRGYRDGFEQGQREAREEREEWER